MMSKYLATITALLLLGASPIVYAQHSPPAGPEAAQIKIMQTVDVLLAGTQWQIKPLQQNSQQPEEELPPKQPPKQQQQPKQPPKQGTYQQPPKQQQQPKQPPKQQQQPPMQQHEEHQQQPPKQQQQPKQPPKQQQQPPKQQHEEHQQMPPQQHQQPKQPPKQQQQYQHQEPQHFEKYHDWDRPDYQKLTWHKRHHHKRYHSPFNWYDHWDFWYDRYHYSDFYFFGMVYDDDWDWLFPGFYTYRWRDYERNDHGFYYRGRRITELILVFDPYDGLVGIGFMYKGLFVFLRDDMEEYYFDDEPTLLIVARILHW